MSDIYSDNVSKSPESLLPVPEEIALTMEPFSEPKREDITTGGIATRYSQWLRTAARSGQWTLAMMEVLPTNELIRLGLFAGGEFATRDPLMGALSIGLSTFAVETVGGLAAAGLLDSDTQKGRSLTEAIVKKSESLHIPFLNKDVALPRELSKTTKIGWTLLGGTVIGMGLEQRQNPERTRAQNRRYSLMTSAWLGGVVAVPGYLAAKGIDIGLNNPLEGGGIALGLISATAVAGWFKKKLSRQKHSYPASTQKEDSQ